MKPTCDLCPREATRWYEPGGHARCGLHEYNDAASVPLTRRPPPPSRAMPGVADLDELHRLLDQAPTVRPPADERCPRCSRILIAAPCDCLAPAQRWVALQREADALWRSMSKAEHVEAVRLSAAGKAVAVQGPAAQEQASCTS